MGSAVTAHFFNNNYVVKLKALACLQKVGQTINCIESMPGNKFNVSVSS